MSLISPLFYQLLYMSIGASLVGLIILLISKLADKRITPFWKILLWLLVVLALIVPFRPQSNLSVMNQVNTIQQVPMIADQMLLTSNSPITNTRTNGNQDKQPNADNLTSIQNSARNHTPIIQLTLSTILPLIWLVGMIMMSSLFIYSRIKINRLITRATPTQTSLLEECKQFLGITRPIHCVTLNDWFSPAIIGVFKPTILLPAYIDSMSNEQVRYVLMHELGHYKRKDTLLNGLLLCLHVLYWFNPIVWLLFKHIRHDIEIANDYYMLKVLGKNHAKSYARSLVDVLSQSHRNTHLPNYICMTDDRQNTKRRIDMIKQNTYFKHPKLMLSLVCIVLITLLTGCFLTSKKTQPRIEFYAISVPISSTTRVDDQEIKTAIQNTSPILSAKDITAYNPETAMFFLSDEIMQNVKEGLNKQPSLDNASSAILNAPKDSAIVITIDDDPAILCEQKKSISSSYLPYLAVIHDGQEGVFLSNYALYTSYADEIDPKGKLKAAFSVLNKLTDDVFSVPSLADNTKAYNIKALWDNKTAYIGDATKVSYIVNHLIFPAKLAYDHIELTTDAEPYTLTIHLNSDTISEENFQSPIYQLAFEQNAKMAFLLIDNVQQVNIKVSTNDDASALFYLATRESNNKEHNAYNDTPAQNLCDFYCISAFDYQLSYPSLNANTEN